MNRPQAAVAGAAAALVWAALEPIDKRIFRNDYSDVAMLGKLVTRSRAWPFAGLAIHCANGATFGLAAHALEASPVGLALAENTALFPLALLIDRRHPGRGSRGLAPLFTARGFAQATFRHVVFALAFARLLGEEPA